jgi:DNA replication protein DnaC
MTGGDMSKENMPNISSGTTKKDNVCPICGGVGYLRRDVPVGHPDFGRAIPCQCKARALEEKRSVDLRQASDLGALARMTFEAFIPEGYALSPAISATLRSAYELALKFADNPQGWLLLRGAYGCGKTHLAAAIANRLLERGERVLFVVVPDLLDYLRATYRSDSAVSYDTRFESVRAVPILILDDLGTENLTSWAQEKLFQIFNYRYNAKLPTVITTNRKLEEIEPRVRSRLMDDKLCKVYTILARDFRGDQGQSDLSSLNLLNDKTFDTFDLRQRELDDDQRDNLRYALQAAREFAERPEGWLVLTGGYGAGKTHLAAAIANHRAIQGYTVLFVVVPDLLDHLRAAYDPRSGISYDRTFDEVRSAPLLVLDDLGAQSSTPWAQEKLFQILNYRYNAKLPTLITMSMSMEEFERLDGRLFARMLDTTLCHHIGLILPSYHGERPRQQAAAQPPPAAPRKPAGRRSSGNYSR